MIGWRKFIFCGGVILLSSALYAHWRLPADTWQAVVITAILAYIGGNVGSKFSKEAGTWALSSTPGSSPEPPSSQP